MWRVWVEMDESAASAEPALIPFTNATMDFTVMSYNILAQDLLEANQQLYTHCPLEVLDWHYRCNLLLKEIEQWLPDVSHVKFMFLKCNLQNFISNVRCPLILCVDFVSSRGSGEPLP